MLLHAQKSTKRWLIKHLFHINMHINKSLQYNSKENKNFHYFKEIVFSCINFFML
jgi:hypothetical protein